MTTLTLDQINEGLQGLLKLQEDTLKSIQVLTTATEEIARKQNRVAKYESDWDSFLSVEMENVFGEHLANKIYKTIVICRNMGDYRYLCPNYSDLGEDLKKRQLLKLISAVDRLKYYTTPGHKAPESYIYALKSEIKYSKMCPHCGEIASKFYDRLVKEGKM